MLCRWTPDEINGRLQRGGRDASTALSMTMRIFCMVNYQIKTCFYLIINHTKKPGFCGPGFFNSRELADVIDASNKEKKPGRTISASRNRAGAGAAGAGNWGGCGAWNE